MDVAKPLETGAWIAIAAYFAVMIAIGVYAWRKSTASGDEYLLGGRSLGPAVTALSAGASDMSGWLLMGLPGAIYLSGMGEAWIGIGLVIGAWANYRLVAARLRSFTERANDAITIPDFFEERFDDKGHVLRLISALVIILFFTLYTSAGMVAGGKFAASALGMSYGTGVLLTAGVVVLYTLLGGFLAVSLTDFVQGCIMFIGLVMVPVLLYQTMGADGTAAGIRAVEAARDMAAGTMTNLFSPTLAVAVSAAAWGLGYFGQPHIIVRFMAIRDVRELPLARRINLGWMAISLAGAILTGLLGAAWVQKQGMTLNDVETIFIVASRNQFVPIIAGVMLSAVLAAIMSTISSQLLVTSSSLVEDIYRTFMNAAASDRLIVTMGRVAVLIVAIVAAALAMNPESSILKLVANAWAGFGAAFGPAVLFALRWRRTTLHGALAGMIVGTVTVVLWSQAGLSAQLYEIVPGFILASLAIWWVSLRTAKPSDKTLTLYDAAVAEAGRY